MYYPLQVVQFQGEPHHRRFGPGLHLFDSPFHAQEGQPVTHWDRRARRGGEDQVQVKI